MRNKNRIPLVIKIFKKGNNAIFMHFLNTKNLELVHKIKSQINNIENFWLKNPDLRFGQLLCVLRLIPDIDIENKIWNKEETIWLVDNNYCSFEEIHFLGY